jgi:hypothetical protein
MRWRRNAVPALAAAVLLAAAPRPAAAQSADCLPEPTLRCVTDGAAAAVERAWPNRSNRAAVDLSALVMLADAQAKAGDKAGAARTAALAREGWPRDSLPLAVLLVRHHPGEDGRAMLMRFVAQYDQDRSKHELPHTMIDVLFPKPVLALAEAGMGTEAAALIARHRAAYDPKIAAAPPQARLRYFEDLVKAYGAVGDKAERAAAAARAWADAQVVEGAPARKREAWMILARAMLIAGAIAEAHAVAAEVRRQFGGHHDYSVVAFEIAAATGDADARATAIAALRERRRPVIGDPGDWVRGETHHQLEALMRAGERAEARAIFAEAKAALATITVRDGDGTPFFALAMLAAAVGDEAEADAMAKRLDAIRDPRATDESHAQQVRWFLVEVCRAYARHGHAAPALRCLARVGESGNLLAHVTRARIELAAAMAKPAR